METEAQRGKRHCPKLHSQEIALSQLSSNPGSATFSYVTVGSNNFTNFGFLVSNMAMIIPTPQLLWRLNEMMFPKGLVPRCLSTLHISFAILAPRCLGCDSLQNQAGLALSLKKPTQPAAHPLLTFWAPAGQLSGGVQALIPGTCALRVPTLQSRGGEGGSFPQRGI